AGQSADADPAGRLSRGAGTGVGRSGGEAEVDLRAVCWPGIGDDAHVVVGRVLPPDAEGPATLKYRALALVHFRGGAAAKHLDKLVGALAVHVDARGEVVVLEDLLDLAELHRTEDGEEVRLRTRGEHVRIGDFGLGRILEHDIAAQRLHKAGGQLRV